MFFKDVASFSPDLVAFFAVHVDRVVVRLRAGHVYPSDGRGGFAIDLTLEPRGASVLRFPRFPDADVVSE